MESKIYRQISELFKFFVGKSGKYCIRTLLPGASQKSAWEILLVPMRSPFLSFPATNVLRRDRDGKAVRPENGSKRATRSQKGLVRRPAATAQGNPVPHFVGKSVSATERNAAPNPERTAAALLRILDQASDGSKCGS